ncbi:MAG TPA: tetratricopeptide repeat protein, partial [Planctomycetota bacterium]|nr:tetratricopeptide repeat protein [Planctomycetota bacterium]
LGAAMLAEGKTGPAEDPLRRAVRADEAFAPARANLGFLLLRSGSLEDAERHLEEAVRLDPNLGPAWNSLGNARWLRGRHASAIEAWHRAWKADPLCLAAGRNLRRQQEIA